MDSSEFYNFLITRASVREYRPDKVEKELANFILDCASTAPSAGNREAWDVVVVESDDKKIAIAEAAYQQVHVGEAALLFVVCANYVRSMSRYSERGILYAIQDATIACTYMMLAVHSLGLVSCWVGAFLEEEVRKELSLPDHVRPAAILCVGKGSQPSSFTERMDIGEHVHRDTW